MSQQTTPTCALGLTSADLSAWRDKALAPDETTRIGAHSEGCPACQQRLEGFEAIAAMLQAQQVPAPDERLWQAVLASLSAEQWTTSDDSITGETHVPNESDDRNPIHQPSTAPRSWRRRALGTLAAVAAIALVVVGFGRVFQFGAQNRPPHAQAFSLTWRQIMLPGGMGATLDASASLSVFPADGSIAWICQSGTEAAPGPLRIWRTTDAGTTWRSVGTPQLTRAFDCQIQLDQMNSGVAVLDLKAYVHPNENQATSASFATFDGGTHWQDNPSTLSMTGFATLNGATYAILPDGAGMNRLMVSNDEMKTWSVFDDVIHNKHLRTMKFWLHPVTGALLVEAFPVDGAIVSLWTTDDSGRDWQQLTTPLLAEPILNPTADGSWDICSMFFAPESEQQPRVYTNRVTCGSTKTGNWTTRPGLSIASTVGTPTPSDCAGCVQVDANGQTYQLALATDGAALAMYSYHFTKLGLPTWSDIYRLPAGSTQWQKGGKLPEGAAFYAPRPDGGILWSMPATAPEGLGNLAGPVYIASYPGPAAPPLPTPPPTPTLTPLPLRYDVDRARPLAWQPTSMPNGFQASQVDPREPAIATTNALAVAPSDSHTAYACQNPDQAGATQTLFWSSHDGGSTWTPGTPPGAVGWCALIVDQTNPNDVLLGISTGAPHSTPDFYYRSVDGGGAWQRVRSLDKTTVTQFASYGTTVYAFRGPADFAGSQTMPLQASNDGMATWRTVDSAIQRQVSVFWLNPYNGELLASSSIVSTQGVEGMPIPSASIWRSDDGGAHWSKLPTPMGYTILVQTPQPNSPWNICLGDDWAGTLYCGDASGQQWTARPALSAKTIFDPLYTALTSDGSILALSAIPNANGYQLYRLPSGANRWLDIGPLPEMTLLYGPVTDGKGILWSTPENTATIDTQGRVFAAAP
jgi:photosystem II stability/assembly factor-like uncharacterized protein